MRDYLDSVVLLQCLAQQRKQALENIDDYYPQPNGASVLAEFVERLAEAAPTDQTKVDLSNYRQLKAPYNDWSFVQTKGREHAQELSQWVLR